MNRCADTNKVRYRTELDALIVLSERAAKDKGEVRAYRCAACKGWHLTSQPQPEPQPPEWDPEYRSRRRRVNNKDVDK